MEQMWRAALDDQVITHDEAVRIYHFRRSEVGPRLTVMTATIAAVNAALGGSTGIESVKFVRRVREHWARKVVPFRRREEDLPPAA